MTPKQIELIKIEIDLELHQLLKQLAYAASDGGYKRAILNPAPQVQGKFDDALNQQNHSSHNLFQIVLRMKSMVVEGRYVEAMGEIAQIKEIEYLYHRIAKSFQS